MTRRVRCGQSWRRILKTSARACAITAIEGAVCGENWCASVFNDQEAFQAAARIEGWARQCQAPREAMRALAAMPMRAARARAAKRSAKRFESPAWGRVAKTIASTLEPATLPR